VIGGLVAAVFGLMDWLAIPRGTRAKAIGAWHGSANGIVVLLFVGSWLLRVPGAAQPPASAVALSFIGVCIGAVGGWLGGELVDRLGIGVDEGANPNAPSSISGVPATRRVA
jgi:uncharacterized membrane protein